MAGEDVARVHPDVRWTICLAPRQDHRRAHGSTEAPRTPRGAIHTFSGPRTTVMVLVTRPDRPGSAGLTTRPRMTTADAAATTTPPATRRLTITEHWRRPT